MLGNQTGSSVVQLVLEKQIVSLRMNEIVVVPASGMRILTAVL